MPTFDPSNIDVLHFLDTLDVRNLRKATENEMRFSCPLPQHGGEDNDPSCYMNIHTANFFCHGCKAKGSAVVFTQDLLGISPLEAIRMLKQAYQPGAINPDARDMVSEVKKILTRQQEKAVQPQLGEMEYERFQLDWPTIWCEWCETKDPILGYWFERGFEPEWLMDWGFGYDELSDRLTIPVRDAHANLIGFKARAYDDRHPKYLVLGDAPNKPGRYGFPRYYPSKVVFGAHRFMNVDRLVICEGELNAIATYEKTGLPAVAINGSFFQEEHAKIIRRIANSVVLFLDDDKAGQEAVWGVDYNGEHKPGIIEMLRDHLDVFLTGPHEKDAADMQAEEISTLIEEARPALLVSLNL